MLKKNGLRVNAVARETGAGKLPPPSKLKVSCIHIKNKSVSRELTNQSAKKDDWEILVRHDIMPICLTKKYFGRPLFANSRKVFNEVINR